MATAGRAMIRRVGIGVKLSLATVIATFAAVRDGLAQLVPAPSAPVRVLALVAPDSVDEYAKIGRRDFGSPTLGISYTYASTRDSGRVRLTAFVYERDSARLSLTASEAVAQQVAIFRQSLTAEQARGTVGQFEIPLEGADTSVVTTSGDTVPGYRLLVVLRREGQTYVSYYTVFAIGNGFVKIRCSVPAEGWERWNLPGIATAIVRRTLAGM